MEGNYSEPISRDLGRMDVLLWVQVVSTAMIVVLTISHFLKGLRAKRELPPGPATWPLIGNLHLLGKLPHQNLQKLASKFGPLMSMKLGSFPALVISSPELAKDVIKVHSDLFANRPPSFAGDIIGYGRQEMLWGDVGPNWRLLRKIAQFELLSASRMASYKTIRSEEVVCTLKDILADSEAGQLVQMNIRMEQLSLNNTSRMLLGERVFGATGENIAQAEELQTVLQMTRAAVGTFVPGQFLPYLRWLDIGGHEAALWSAFKRSDILLSAIVDQHRAKLANTGNEKKQAPDCLDVMLSLSGEDKISDDSIKGFCVDIMLGGSDTTSSQVQWVMAELMGNPSAREQAQEELRSVVGLDRLVEETDIPNLPYLRAVVKEGMRMHPVVPLISHVSREETQIGGYFVPKDMRVVVNMYSIQRDPKVWDRPLEFDPSRHLATIEDTTSFDFSLLPFGAGKRVCPGRNLGLLLVHFILANLLHAFDWAMPPGKTHKDVDFREAFGLTLPPKTPLALVATPRLALNLGPI